MMTMLTMWESVPRAHYKTERRMRKVEVETNLASLRFFFSLLLVWHRSKHGAELLTLQ